MNYFRKITFFILLLSIFTVNSFAHPGRTDSNGGHYNHATGEYHYHDGKSGSGSSDNDENRNDLPPVISHESNSGTDDNNEYHVDSSDENDEESSSSQPKKDESWNPTIWQALWSALGFAFYGTIPLMLLIIWICDKLFEADINPNIAAIIGALIIITVSFLIIYF